MTAAELVEKLGGIDALVQLIKEDRDDLRAYWLSKAAELASENLPTILTALRAQTAGEGEERCRRCGHENPAWSAPSPLWNAVMRGGCINGEAQFEDMVCAACFMALAQASGIASRFRVTAETVNVPLQTVTPTGRIWDGDKWLWVAALDTRQQENGDG